MSASVCRILGGLKTPGTARARYCWPGWRFTVLLSRRSSTSTGSLRSTASVPSQRSCTIQIVPRIVAAAKRPFVRKVPFAEPHSCCTGFWFADSERGVVQKEKSPPTSVSTVRLPSTSTRNRAGNPLAAPSRLSSRNSLDEKLPKLPSKPVNVMTPFVTSTMSPTLRMNTASAGWTIPLTITVPVPTALYVLGAEDAGGGGGVVVRETTFAEAEAVLFSA